MVSLKNKSKGFTIVELLIVIVVIGILATLVIVTFTGIQQKARNSQRQTDINAVDSHVEAYYASNGYYPAYADVNTPAWVSTNMKGLDPQALIGPKGGTLSNTTDPGTGVAAGDAYNYYAKESGTGNACTTADTNCDTFVVSALLEGGATQYVKKSN